MKSNGLVIRDARFEELDAVAKLIREAYQQYQKYLPAQAWELYLEDIVNVRSRFGESDLIVAQESSRLVGTVTLYLTDSPSSQETWPKNWAGIRLLAVHPEFRSRGIGFALMEECMRRCRDHGIATIALHTTEFMEVARRMYEKMGFRRALEFDAHPRPDVLVMAYRLDLK